MSKHFGSTRERARHIAGILVRLAVNPALLLNVVAPVIGYQLLVRHGVGSTAALMCAAGFPLLVIAIAGLRNHRLDPIALLALVAIMSGLAAGAVWHDGRILLVKDSIVTGVLGAVFLMSVPTRRPMILVLQRMLLSSGDGVDRLDHTPARSRRMTALWGVVLIAEAATRIVLSFVVSPGILLVISPLLAAVAFGPLALWTLRQRLEPGPAGSPSFPTGNNPGVSRGPTSL